MFVGSPLWLGKCLKFQSVHYFSDFRFGANLMQIPRIYKDGILQLIFTGIKIWNNFLKTEIKETENVVGSIARFE